MLMMSLLCLTWVSANKDSNVYFKKLPMWITIYNLFSASPKSALTLNVLIKQF